MLVYPEGLAYIQQLSGVENSPAVPLAALTLAFIPPPSIPQTQVVLEIHRAGLWKLPFLPFDIHSLPQFFSKSLDSLKTSLIKAIDNGFKMLLREMGWSVCCSILFPASRGTMWGFFSLFGSALWLTALAASLASLGAAFAVNWKC